MLRYFFCNELNEKGEAVTNPYINVDIPETTRGALINTLLIALDKTWDDDLDRRGACEAIRWWIKDGKVVLYQLSYSRLGGLCEG
ncbi:hypothetical protein [Escherichia coli]|uniref:hypothetical protein n=1 Tax=Escherichia coli TaxID=562 RepID=UPI0039A0EE96